MEPTNVRRTTSKAKRSISHGTLQYVAVIRRPLPIDELTKFLAFGFDARPTLTCRAAWRPEDPFAHTVYVSYPPLSKSGIQALYIPSLF